MSTYPKGSQGEKEQKQNRVIAIAFSAISVLVLLILFVIPNQLHDNVKVAAGWLQVTGGLLVVASAGLIIYGAYGTADTTSFGKWWAILLAAGIFIAAGFFDTLY